ncbi:aminopeptidase [Conexibacter woesei]|uniref:Peptidase M29 aminopeptidase II n=1 Tax=Conexibacter woesei (strain DSM 14684 / CCUG 47730 / CIP 108061 / JCM 11494 / NBRC 100937 / ID131577) TaxID=469383 RepID=D3F5D9_CONWI|nr:aminopeptidase [Conexibacter woesei]ADB50606.1 peptidase M29 aminopeptidase II [Conexibacter woesei DSM 14684]
MSVSAFDDPATLARYADLVVGFAANVQDGQLVEIASETGKEALTRALAASAYQHGASYVDATYFDPYVKRARLLHAGEQTLDELPALLGERVLALGEARAARIALAGPVAPDLLDGVDPRRTGRDRLPRLPEDRQLIDACTTNWTVVPCPTREWAQLVHPELDADAAWARLCDQIVHVLRLDAPDPTAAWRERQAQLAAVSTRLTARRFDAVHFSGPGTDLRVGLLPRSPWLTVAFETVDGIAHLPNLPSEEVYATPDPARVEGVVRATKPLMLDGTAVEGLELEFRDGRAVRVDAERGAELVRAQVARDEGAARLGEVALVDGDGRVGALETVFLEILLDENAASHVALGAAYSVAVAAADAGRENSSAIHLDVVIGGPAVDVDGVEPGGARVPLLRAGAWAL